METGTAREGRWGRNGDGNGRRGGRRKQVGHRGPGGERSPLVEDVSDYWDSYEEGGANEVWHLQYP